MMEYGTEILCTCPHCGAVSTWDEWGGTTLDADEECREALELLPGDEWKDDGLTVDVFECPACEDTCRREEISTDPPNSLQE